MNGDQNKDSAIKTLAIIGFTAMIVLGVWLAVQMVQIAPSAFTSLASLAEQVYGEAEVTELTAVTSKSVVNNDETFELRWTEANVPGVHQFSYQCTEGVTLSKEDSNGELMPVVCDDPVNLPDGGVAELQITSASQRFIDIYYTLAFIPEGEVEASITDFDRVTVVNATIPQNGLVAGVQDEEAEEAQDDSETAVEETDAAAEASTDLALIEESVVEEPVEETETPAETIEEAVEETPEVAVAEETPVVEPTPTPAPEPQFEFVYELPESDPNGFVDLDVDYLGVGHLQGQTFVARAEIDNDEQGALKFSVTNIGTKTSDRWEYEVEMPNGVTYNSPRQDGLKPNETATIILGFSVSETGLQTFGGEVAVADDRSNANNEFAWSVTVTN